MSERFDVWVTTHFYRHDGMLFCDLGTMHWPGVTPRVKSWLADSCRTTAFWLVGVDETPGGYSLMYRTLVKRAGTDEVVSEIGPIWTHGFGYQDVLRFERYALAELEAMVVLFEEEHTAPAMPSRKRNKLVQWWSWIGRMLHDRFYRGPA